MGGDRFTTINGKVYGITYDVNKQKEYIREFDIERFEFVGRWVDIESLKEEF